MNGRREQHLRQQMTEGMFYRFQSVSKFVTFESPQALRASALPKKKFLMLQPRVYLKTPNAPGQRAFLRCAASFFLEIRQYSCEKMSCATQKSLAAGHIMSFQIHPSFAFKICRAARICRRSYEFAEDFRKNSISEKAYGLMLREAEFVCLFLFGY